MKVGSQSRSSHSWQKLGKFLGHPECTMARAPGHTCSSPSKAEILGFRTLPFLIQEEPTLTAIVKFTPPR